MASAGRASTALLPLLGCVWRGEGRNWSRQDRLPPKVALTHAKWLGQDGNVFKALTSACTVITHLCLLCSNIYFKGLICAGGKMPMGACVDGGLCKTQ